MHTTFFKTMGYVCRGVPRFVKGCGDTCIGPVILVYYSMGKSFNATVDWLGMVENPDQDVNPSVNGEMAQTGIEFDPNLLSIEDYRNKVSDHYNTNINTNEWNLGDWKDDDHQWGRYPSYLANVNYKTPYHPSGITDDGLNCIQGVGCFLADAGVTSMEDPNNPGFGQYTGNQTFSSKAASSEGYIYNFNPHTERSDGGKNLIYEGDILQVIQQNDQGRVNEGQPFHAQIVMDAGDPSLPPDKRYITIGDNEGGEKWRGRKYLLSKVLENLREDWWRLSAYDPDLVKKNYREEENYNSTFQDNEWINKHASRDIPYFTGPNDKKDWADNPEWTKTNWMGSGGYDYPDGQEWRDDPWWVYENYSKHYDKIGAISNMSPNLLDKLIHNQGGIRMTESGKKWAKLRQFGKDSAINIFGKENARSVFGGDDPSWRQYYWDKNIKNINSEFDTYDDWVSDIYAKQNTMSYHITDAYYKSPQSKGEFQQKELSPRGRYFFSILGRDIDWEDRDDQVLASTMLAIDNFHILKKVHEDLGTKINGKKLTNEHLVDLASLMHSSPGKAQSKEFVEYFFKNYLDGTKGDDGIGYLDMVKMYRAPRYQYENKNKEKKKLISRKTGGQLLQAQNGIENTERQKYIDFALIAEGGHDYIRAKDSAVKKLSADGTWDGKSYYKIYEDGKYYPYYTSDEKTATVGHGHHNDEVFNLYKGGIDEDTAIELLNKDIDSKLRLSRIYYDRRFGEGTWNKLDENTQFMLNDYSFNIGNNFGGYNNFVGAIESGDWETALKEYKRKDNPGGYELGRNELFLETYLQPWVNRQKERSAIAPPLDEMPLPIGVFPTDSEGNAQSMKSNMYMEGSSPFNFQVPPAVQDNTRVGPNVFGGWEIGGELPKYMDGAPHNAKGSAGTRPPSYYEDAAQSRTAMPSLPSLDNDLTVDNNLTLSNTIAELAQKGKELDLTPQIDILIERISSPAFKDQVYAQHKNIHGYKPNWDWDAVLAKQIELITKGYKDATYDPTVMTPLNQDYIDSRKKDGIVMGAMSSQGDKEDIGNIYYNQEEFIKDPEKGDLVALHEVSHRLNAMEKTELTPYITQIFGKGDQSGKMGIKQTNAAAEEERNYLENMMKYGITYFPESGTKGEEDYNPRSKYDYNWIGNRVGRDSDNYLTIPGEGHAFKTVLQEELKGLGIHDFNSGAFDDTALEKLYNMTAEQFESLDQSTQDYLRGLGITEIIYPDARGGKWLDESSVEDKKNDAERKENIFQYMNEFWGRKEEIGDDLPIQWNAKYGGQYNWALDLRSSETPRAQAGKEVKSDDLYSTDRYSQSATKYKKMLPKYQSKGEYPAHIKSEREKKQYDLAMSKGWVYDTRLPNENQDISLDKMILIKH